ncbi:hypothetical protein AAFF_G00048710 [Aldrovandia affinis]|uniref:Ig-like domain-containing protein n=1 Tax=Aldrovandia affinis TaxID=143900 RepID=A0AAD7WEX4_9TELE|nr:hypothetical protein AAFF_G00048710 [Aldrovandia affinis]
MLAGQAPVPRTPQTAIQLGEESVMMGRHRFPSLAVMWAPPSVRIVHSGHACNVEEERYTERVYTIREGETLELTCLVTGHPRPQKGRGGRCRQWGCFRDSVTQGRPARRLRASHVRGFNCRSGGHSGGDRSVACRDVTRPRAAAARVCETGEAFGRRRSLSFRMSLAPVRTSGGAAFLPCFR